MPTLSRSMCETEIQNASTVWPESVRPLWSAMVTDTMTGNALPGGFEIFVDGKQRGLGVQRVENGLDQQQDRRRLPPGRAPVRNTLRAICRR